MLTNAASVNHTKVYELAMMPLLLINITTAANNWEFLGIHIGQMLFWLIIIIAFGIAVNTPYRYLASGSLIVALGCFSVERFMAVGYITVMGKTALSMVFMIAGAEIYGRNPFLMRKQLLIFLGLCIPVMLMQIMGVSSFFMGWDVDYAHNLSILSIEEIGTFKNIPVYPTLFVGLDQLHYQIGQGRPCGLLYSNNVLTIFICVAAVLQLTLAEKPKLGLGDVIIAGVAVLSSSQTVFLAVLLINLILIVFGSTQKRIHCVKFLVLWGTFYGLFSFFFPGIFHTVFSEAKFWSSFLNRFMEVFILLGFNDAFNVFSDQISMVVWVEREEETFSTMAMLLKNENLIPIICGMATGMLIYFVRMIPFRKAAKQYVSVYAILVIVCVMTQFSIPYIKAPSFQVILGLAFFPMFGKMWTLKRLEAS